jgi:ketosteroid isomerase-like protein
MTSDMRVEAAQEFFQKSFRGEVSSAIELLDEKVSYHVPGSHQASGLFEGPEAVAEHLGKLLRLTNRTVNVLQWEDWMVGVNHVAALAHMRVQSRGAVYTFRAVYLIAMTDDAKIRRIEIFFDDQAAAERFFSAVVE